MNTQTAPTLAFMTPDAPPPAISEPNPRQEQIEAALRKAREEWKAQYREFILAFAETATEPFTAEDVREAYLATPGVATTDHEQASGGIFQRLVRERKLHKRGMERSRRYGNFLQSYTKY